MPKIRLNSTIVDSTDSTPVSRRDTQHRPSADTIDVKQKIAAISIKDDSDEGIGHRTSRRRSANRRTSTGELNTARSKKGKAPVRPSILEIIDSDEGVEEYQFSSDEDLEEHEDDFSDAGSIISVSSESSTDSVMGISERPWEDFTAEKREQWEIMYSSVTMHPLGGNWEVTEDYQREKDAEMLRYMEDYPLNQWIIPQEEANKAYFRLLERTRWRSLGIRIYGRERIPEWIPGSTSTGRLQQALNIPRDKYPREPQSESSRPEYGPQPSGLPHGSIEQTRPSEPPRPPGQVPHPGDHASAPLPQHSLPPHLLPPQPQHPQVPPTGPYSQLPPPGQHSHQHSMQHRAPPLLPPQHSLPSQPYAQPMRVAPHVPMPPGMGHHIGLSHQIPYDMPPGLAMQMAAAGNSQPPPSYKSRRAREKKESPVHSTPPPPPPTPPYELRQKPTDKKGSKSSRRNPRRQAEAEEFPWTRDLNFKEVKTKATWDDSVYDAKALAVMNATRARNVQVIEDLDTKVQEQQRAARVAKKNKPVEEKPAESSEAEGKGKKKMQRGQRKENTGNDPYHSGAFAFASAEDERMASDLGYGSPDDVLLAGEEGKIEAEVQASLKIYWNPGKKGMTENLEQMKFTVKDTLVTREQLEHTPVLNKRAAECIIDFCPDMLWRGMLLRICSEAGYGNKDVRDRFCYNGCYCDKATITKRISAALGQKQVQPKSKGYGPGEWEWYDKNVKDFAKYIDFFGKRTSHRNMLKIQMQGEKRKLKEERVPAGEDGDGDGDSSGDDKEDEGGSRKRLRRNQPQDSDAAGEEGEEGEEGEDGHESEGTDDSNAVSLQDSDILDKIED